MRVREREGKKNRRETERERNRLPISPSDSFLQSLKISWKPLKVFIMLLRYFKMVPINESKFYVKIMFWEKRNKLLQKNSRTVYQVVWDCVVLLLFANLSVYIISSNRKTSKRNNKKNTQDADFFAGDSRDNLILEINQLCKHYVKSARIRSFSDPYFWTRKTSNMDTFHTVKFLDLKPQRPKATRKNFKILQHLLQDYFCVTHHFGTLCTNVKANALGIITFHEFLKAET